MKTRAAIALAPIAAPPMLHAQVGNRRRLAKFKALALNFNSMKKRLKLNAWRSAG